VSAAIAAHRRALAIWREAIHFGGIAEQESAFQEETAALDAVRKARCAMRKSADVKRRYLEALSASRDD
jgi:hypothetical protein